MRVCDLGGTRDVEESGELGYVGWKRFRMCVVVMERDEEGGCYED